MVLLDSALFKSIVRVFNLRHAIAEADIVVTAARNLERLGSIECSDVAWRW